MARRMVTQFGMSEVVGPIAVGDRDAEIFLGREVVQRREISERTAELVDPEAEAHPERMRSSALGPFSRRSARGLDRLAAALARARDA